MLVLGLLSEPFQRKTAFPLQLTPPGAFFVTRLDLPFPITGRSPFPAFFPLVVGEAQMWGRLSVTLPLHLKALMADAELQSVPFIGSVLHQRPLFAPDVYVLPLVMFPVFPPVEAIRPDSPCGYEDMDVRVIP